MYLTLIYLTPLQSIWESMGKYGLVKITLEEDSYKKLVAVKEALNCRTWKQLADKLYEIHVAKTRQK